ncbi:FCD domain-containing protein [Xylophilus sp. Kf1]|nr:FCD domain-containing protein [Xylophilus sp. Kf1]
MTQPTPHAPGLSPPEEADLPDGPRRGRNLTHTLVEALGRQLRDGTIRPGDKLPSESAIMQGFGVGRGVVREALSRLAAAGMVQTQHGIGTFALAPDRDGRFHLQRPEVADLDDLLSMLELRTSVESDAAGLAATRRSDAHLQAMRAALDDFGSHLSTVGETVSPDFRFHLAIAHATGNRYYSDLMDQLGMAAIPSSRMSSVRLDPLLRERHLMKVHQEHHDIYAAIERHDPEAARAAMRIHLVNSRERQRRASTVRPDRPA